MHIIADNSLEFGNLAINREMQNVIVDEGSAPPVPLYQSITASKWGMGWQTPSLMIAYYFLCMTLAASMNLSY